MSQRAAIEQTSEGEEPVSIPGPVLSREQAENVARVLKAVADPTRIQLLSMIEGSENGEACVCDLTEPLGLTQPTISHHLKIMVEAGILAREKRGVWAWYSVVPDQVEAVRAFLPPR